MALVVLLEYKVYMPYATNSKWTSTLRQGRIQTRVMGGGGGDCPLHPPLDPLSSSTAIRHAVLHGAVAVRANSAIVV